MYTQTLLNDAKTEKKSCLKKELKKAGINLSLLQTLFTGVYLWSHHSDIVTDAMPFFVCLFITHMNYSH